MKKHTIDKGSSIQSTIILLNEIVTKLDGVKFDSMGQYHNIIKDAINDAFSFADSIELSIWGVKYYDNESIEHIYLFDYNKATIVDGRASKYNEFGKIANIKFTLCTTYHDTNIADPINYPDADIFDTIEGLIANRKKAHLFRQILSQLKDIQKMEQEIKEANVYVDSLKLKYESI